MDCNQGGAQDSWLRADLAAHPRRCTLAYFHHPRFSSAGHYESEGQAFDRAVTLPFWNTLYAYGVDVVVNGHSHIAERFGPQDTWGHPAPGRGIAQFTVGSGGINPDRIIGVSKNSRFARRPSGWRIWPWAPATTAGASCAPRTAASWTRARAAATEPAPAG